MERISVPHSSNVAEIGYDPALHLLEIAFAPKKGITPIYQYKGVPHEKWTGLLHAASKGGYLNEFVKPYFEAVRVQ